MHPPLHLAAPHSGSVCVVCPRLLRPDGPAGTCRSRPDSWQGTRSTCYRGRNRGAYRASKRYGATYAGRTGYGVPLAVCVAVAGCAATHPARGPVMSSRTASSTPRERAVADAAAILKSFVVPRERGGCRGRQMPQGPEHCERQSGSLCRSTKATKRITVNSKIISDFGAAWRRRRDIGEGSARATALA